MVEIEDVKLPSGAISFSDLQEVIYHELEGKSSNKWRQDAAENIVTTLAVIFSKREPKEFRKIKALNDNGKLKTCSYFTRNALKILRTTRSVSELRIGDEEIALWDEDLKVLRTVAELFIDAE